MLQLALDFRRFILLEFLFSVACQNELFPPIISPSPFQLFSLLLQEQKHRAQTSPSQDETPAPEAPSSYPWGVFSWHSSDLLICLLGAQTRSLAFWLSLGAVPARTDFVCSLSSGTAFSGIALCESGFADDFKPVRCSSFLPPSWLSSD